MEAELATLAVSGATTVVGLMAGDAWTAAKSRVVALFRQGRSEPAAVEDELEESRRELIAARDEEDEAVAAGVQALWLMRLRRLLQENPDLAVKLQELITEAGPAGAPDAPGHTNSITGGEFSGPVIQTGRIDGGIHIGDPGPRTRRG